MPLPPAPDSSQKPCTYGPNRPWFLWDLVKLSSVPTHAQEEFFIKFAEFEEKAREVERARAIYRYALDHIPKVCLCVWGGGLRAVRP